MDLGPKFDVKPNFKFGPGLFCNRPVWQAFPKAAFLARDRFVLTWEPAIGLKGSTEGCLIKAYF